MTSVNPNLIAFQTDLNHAFQDFKSLKENKLYYNFILSKATLISSLVH